MHTRTSGAGGSTVIEREGRWSAFARWVRNSDQAIRALLVIADQPVANLADLSMRHGSYARRIVGTVNDGRSAIELWKPHLLIVDIDVEDGRALQLIDGRSAERPMAVIAVTRRGDLQGKLDAFERGAEDFISVPFVPDDLVARSRAVIRRTFGDPGRMVRSLRIGDLEIDMLHRRVRAGDSELHLTSLEQALLYLFAANAGKVLSTETILDTLWGTDFVVESGIVDRHVRALRAKLQNDWYRPRYIETVAGGGYRFIPVVEG